MSLSQLPPGMTIEQALETLFEAIHDNQSVNYAAVAATALVAYDVILTFPQEVELVWKTRWTLPKALYIAVRYYGLVCSAFYLAINSSYTLSLDVCRFWQWYEIFGCVDFIFLLSEVMFLLRLWGSYERNNKVLALVLICFVAEIVGSFSVGILQGRAVHIVDRPPNFPIPGCYTAQVDVPLTRTLSGWVLYCAIGTVYLLLMVHQCLTSQAFKTELSNVRLNPIAKFSELRRLSPLIYVLVRDGLMYFLMMFVVVLLNMALTIRFSGRAIEEIGIPWIIAVSSIASSRLFLNLRGFLGRRSSLHTKTHTTMRFSTTFSVRYSEYNRHSESQRETASTAHRHGEGEHIRMETTHAESA